jgi:hypothetical protein
MESVPPFYLYRNTIKIEEVKETGIHPYTVEAAGNESR